MDARFCLFYNFVAILFKDPSQSILANSVITALFAVSIPYQGLYFLGKRSKSPLPLHLMGWYEELRQKLANENIKLTACPVQSIPSYQDFANLLQLAEKTWGNKYFDEL
ncbi:membrane protein [Haemophilus parahaemolyticus HK385]|nr:membrane protein [Haemophilus parahaemolyticus HK385]